MWQAIDVIRVYAKPDQVAAQQMVLLEAAQIDHLFDPRRPHDRAFERLYEPERASQEAQIVRRRGRAEELQRIFVGIGMERFGLDL